MKLRTQSLISFTAGKTTLYSDFDGTFYPYSQNSNLKDSKTNTDANKYFSKIHSLKNNFNDKLDIKLTTGRTYGEIKDIFQKADKSGVSIPMPSSIITKNGGDEFYNTNSQITPFPFDKSTVNYQKRETIKNISNGWEGEKIQSKIMEILADNDLKIVSAPTNGPIEDYGVLTSQNILRNSPNTDIALMRQDGMLGFNIAFSIPNKDKGITHSVKKEIKDYFDKNRISSTIIEADSDFGATGMPSLTILPNVNGAALTKTFDISKAIETAKKENDLVIIAGDGGNDKEALNPASYIKNNDKNFPHYIENSETSTYRENNNFYVNSKLDGKTKRAYYSKYLDSLGNYIQTNSEYKKELSTLPMKSIVIGDSHESLNKLVDTYKKVGLSKKILQFPKEALPEGTLAAIKEYRKENESFNKGLLDSDKNITVNLQTEYNTNQIILKNINNIAQDTTTPDYNPVNNDLKIKNCKILVRNLTDGSKYLKLKDKNNQTIITLKTKNNTNLPQINLHTGNFTPAIELKDANCSVLLSEDSYIKTPDFIIGTGKYIDKARSNVAFGHLYITEAYKAQSVENAVQEYFTQEKYNDISDGKYKNDLKYDYSLVGLAAGYGSRLSVISDKTNDAKPATPFISHRYRLIDFSILNTGIKSGIIKPNIENYNNASVFDTINKNLISNNQNSNLTFLQEKEEKPIGTGGSLFSALKNNVVKTDKPLVMTTGDLYTNIDLSYALKEFENKNAGLLVVYKTIGKEDINKLPIIKLDKYKGTSYVKQFCHVPNNNDEENYIKKQYLQDEPNKYATTTSIYIMHPKVLEVLKHISGDGTQSYGSYLPMLRSLLNGNGQDKINADNKTLLKLQELNLIDKNNISKGLRDNNGNYLTMIADLAKREDGQEAVAEDVGTYKRFIEQARKTARNDFDKYKYFPKKYLSEMKELVDCKSGIIFSDSKAKNNFQRFLTKQNVKEIQGDIIISCSEDNL